MTRYPSISRCRFFSAASPFRWCEPLIKAFESRSSKAILQTTKLWIYFQVPPEYQDVVFLAQLIFAIRPLLDKPSNSQKKKIKQLPETRQKHFPYIYLAILELHITLKKHFFLASVLFKWQNQHPTCSRLTFKEVGGNQYSNLIKYKGQERTRVIKNLKCQKSTRVYWVWLRWN